MIEQVEMEGQEVELEDLTVSLLPKGNISPDHLEKLLALFRAGYGNDWLGDEMFRNVRMKNVTESLELTSQNQLAAAILFDNLRILLITVHPDFQGHGLGVKLLQEAANAHPKTWISVSLDAEPVLHTVTDKRLNYVPIEDQTQIEDMLRNINGGKANPHVDMKEVEIPYLTQRLAERGIVQNKFQVFAAKAGSTHGQQYWQILFQNQPNSIS